MLKLLVVATPHYTGTHSIMNFIDSEGYSRLAESLIHTKEKRSNRDSLGKGKIWAEDTGGRRHIWLSEMAVHWPDMKRKGYKIYQHPILDYDKTNIIHGHIIPETLEILQELSEIKRLIVTVRDPLAALISCKVRDLSKTGREDVGEITVWMEQCLTEWELLATEIDKLDPFYVPIDLDLTGYTYFGINFSSLNGVVASSRGNYKLKKFYQDGKLETIKYYLGEGYDRLIELRPVLQPVLEKIGYKDLLWWT